MHRDAGGRDRKTRQQRRTARNVARSGNATGNHVLDFCRRHAGALHRMLDRMAEHRHVGRVVEPAARGLCQAGTRIRNNDCLTHRKIPFLVPPQSARSLPLRHPGEEHNGCDCSNQSRRRSSPT